LGENPQGAAHYGGAKIPRKGNSPGRGPQKRGHKSPFGEKPPNPKKIGGIIKGPLPIYGDPNFGPFKGLFLGDNTAFSEKKGGGEKPPYLGGEPMEGGK